MIWNDCPLCGEELIYRDVPIDEYFGTADAAIECKVLVGEISHYGVLFYANYLEQELFISDNELVFARYENRFVVRKLNSYDWYRFDCQLPFDKLIKMTKSDLHKLLILS